MPIRASLSIALSTDKHRVTGSRGQQDSSMGPTPTWHFDPRPCGDRGLPQLQIQKRAEVIQVLVHASCGPYEGLIEHWRGVGSQRSISGRRWAILILALKGLCISYLVSYAAVTTGSSCWQVKPNPERPSLILVIPWLGLAKPRRDD